MSRKFLIVNRNLVATPRERRRTGWRISENENRGHPMVSRRYESNYDYLRLSSARYFSWNDGTSPSNYSEFRYLQYADIESQGSYLNSVGFNAEVVSEFSFTEIPDPWIVGIVANSFSGNDLLASTDIAFGRRPHPGPNVIGVSRASNNSQLVDILLLTGSNTDWTGYVDGMGIQDQYKVLFNEPFWSNWQGYVLGNGAVPSKPFYGLFGNSGGELYLDHKFEKNLPTRDQHSVVINYNYYNTFFDELKNKSEISELYIPNLYSVYSIASNGGYLYEQLYGNSSDSRGWVATQIIEPTLGSSIDNDFLTNSDIPLGQIQISSQVPDSILSRFARKNFAETPAGVESLNRHLGLAPELLSGSDNLLSDISGRQESYPYSAEVNFPLAGTDDLFDSTDSNDALKFFLFEVMKANILNFETGSYDFYQKLDFSALESTEEQNKYYGFDWNGPGNWIPENNPEATQPYKVNAIDLNNLFANIFSQLGTTVNYGDGELGDTYYGFVNQVDNINTALVQGTGSIIGQEYFSNPEATLSGDDEYNIFEDSAQGFILNLADKLNDKARKYEEVLNGTDSYNKTLVYKLDKHRVSSATGQPLPEPIQSIYFPNIKGATKYIDTQVKSGERYLYKAYSYDLVVGNQYKYINPQVYPPLPNAYPSLLGPLMGFGVDVGAEETDLSLLFPGLQGKQIYVGTEINFTTVTNIGVALLALYTSDASNNLYSQNEWFNENYSFYFDYRLDPANSEFQTEELDGILGAGSLGVNSRNVNLNLVASKIQEVLGSAWRVRFVISELGQNVGRFVIARTQDLNSLTSAERVALLNIILSVPASDIDSLFNLNQSLDLAVPGQLPVTQFLFNSGPHGSSPITPLDLSRAGEAEVQVQNYKSVKILELPYFETNVFEVVDLPPQFPDVDIIPLKGESKRIKILLNESATRNSYLPISIEEEDNVKFEEIRIGQGRLPGEALVFGSDDSIVSFQVYRTDIAPTTYKDFAGQRKYTLQTVTPSGRSITTASTLDSIEPNVIYYYCFRTIDKNGFISVPSPILKVQMVDDNGRVYPIILPYDLPSTETRTAEKSFRRYLEIDTSLDSKKITGVDAAAESAGNPLQPPGQGISLDGTVWADDVTFKVRVVSKDTGRKIDLNLNFNVEGISNPNLQDN
jgi:hypothetical protein